MAVDAVELAEAVEVAEAVAVAVAIPMGAAVAVSTTIRNRKRRGPRLGVFGWPQISSHDGVLP